MTRNSCYNAKKLGIVEFAEINGDREMQPVILILEKQIFANSKNKRLFCKYYHRNIKNNTNIIMRRKSNTTNEQFRPGWTYDGEARLKRRWSFRDKGHVRSDSPNATCEHCKTQGHFRHQSTI